MFKKEVESSDAKIVHMDLNLEVVKLKKNHVTKWIEELEGVQKIWKKQ